MAISLKTAFKINEQKAKYKIYIERNMKTGLKNISKLSLNATCKVTINIILYNRTKTNQKNSYYISVY